MKIKLSKLILKEGMSVMVAGAENASKRFDNILDISTHLESIAYRIISNLPEDQQTYFSKNRPFDLLTIDGSSDMDSPTGILNLYYSGYTKSTLLKILKAVLKELKRLNIEYKKPYIEQSRMAKYQVVRIPVIKNNSTYSGPPNLHFSNRNAYHIFHNILGFDAVDEYDSGFEMTAEELKSATEAILKHDPEWINLHRIPTQNSEHPKDERDDVPDFKNPHEFDVGDTSNGRRGTKAINMGLESEDIKQRLELLWTLADWAIKHGHTKIYVG